MNILLVTPEFPPVTIGGGGIVYENLSEQLNLKGHSVTVIAGDFSNRKAVGKVEKASVAGLEVDFIPLMPFPKTKKLDLLSYTFPTITGTKKILKEIAQSKNTVVHLHGLCHPMINLAALFCILFHKKYLLTCHGILKSPEKSQEPIKFLFNVYLSTIVRLEVKKAWKLTVVSNTLAAECRSKNLVNDSTVIIPNGPNTSLGKVTPNLISDIEKKYSLQNKKVIFAVGRLNPTKGFQFLVDAMQTVAKKVPNAVAVIAGAGAYKASLETLIRSKGLSENVKLIGWVSEESKAALYERSEVVVFPSLQEPFGIVVLEALMMHKPIVAFNTESSMEIIKKGTGLLVPTGNSEELANAIIKIVSDKQLREDIIANIERTKICGWSEITDRYLQIYDNLMKEEMLKQ